MTNTKVIAGVGAIVVVCAIVIAFMLVGNSGDGKSDIKGTYVFQEGTYAEIVDGKVEYSSLTDVDDIIIESYSGNVFYAKWGNDVFIGSIKDGYLQGEDSFTKDGKKHCEICYGFLENNTLVYTANCIDENGKEGATTAIFAKKGTTAEKPSYKPLFEVGQEFESVYSEIMMDGEYYNTTGLLDHKMKIVDYKYGIYAIKDESKIEGVELPDVTFAVHKYSNELICMYSDGSIGCLVCSSDKINAHFDYVFDGKHVIVGSTLSSSGKIDANNTLAITGKTYEGKTYSVDSKGKIVEGTYTVTFGEAQGNIFEMKCISDGEEYKVYAYLMYDSEERGYYVNYTDRYDGESSSFTDFNFGYIKEGLNTFYEVTNSFYGFGVNATSFSELSLKKSSDL